MKTLWAGWAVIGVGLLHGAAIAQPVAEAPGWKVGDTWEFRRQVASDERETKWSRKIVELIPDGKLGVRVGQDKVEQYDAAFNFIPDGRADFVRVLARYPLAVGSEWTYTRRFNNANLEEKGKAKVVAYESVTVPAGTFNCFRIEIDASFGSMGVSTQNLWTRWYCPVVKWIAKEHLETRTFNRYAPPSVVKATSELVKFTPGP